jgi:hypothetical protein
MKEITKGLHPKPLPGFEMGYYPSEWLYWDDEEHHTAAGIVSEETEV